LAPCPTVRIAAFRRYTSEYADKEKHVAKTTPTTKGAPALKATVSLAAVSDAGTLPTITIPPGGTLTIVVDVGPMTIPYTVAYAGHNVIKSLVDRAENVAPLLAGDRLLVWAFSHTEKEWHHAIGCSIDGGAVQLLERKSEAKKDPDHSLGAAIVKA
jgi:hypothetical protein